MVARVVAGEIDTGENIFGGVSKCRVFNGIETPVMLRLDFPPFFPDAD